MFYWKHEEAAYYGQSQVEGNGSLALGHDNCQKPKWRFRQHGKKSTFFLDKDRQECSTLVMATRLPRSTPHLEQVTLTGPWLTHPVLQGSQMTDSYSTMQVLQCWMPAPGATSSHWMWLLYASPYEPDLQCVPLNNTKVLKDLEGGGVEGLQTSLYLGSFRSHRAYWWLWKTTGLYFRFTFHHISLKSPFEIILSDCLSAPKYFHTLKVENILFPIKFDWENW